MITAITLESFKSYRQARLSLAPLTVMVGANASGKSNFIEAMRLISWIAQGQRLSSIQYAIQSGERVLRGTIDDLAYQRGGEFGFQVETSERQWNRLSMRLARRADGLHITSESLSHEGATVPLYTLDQPSSAQGTDVGVAYNNFVRGASLPHVSCTDQLAIFTQLTSPASFEASDNQSRERIPTVARDLEKWLSAMLFLDPVPARMRDYSFPTDAALQGDGSNVSAVLYHLWGRDDVDAASLASHRHWILGFIQSLPEQKIEGLSFLEEPRGGVMVKLRETFGGEARDYDASLLSDGTLRVLAIAAAMLSAPEGSLVVIEEIDNGVHPSRAHHLLHQIRQIAEERSLRVLLSTHNPALLDALPDSAVPDVLFCYRDLENGSSRLVRLADLPEYPELVAQGTLGHLMTSGLLDRFVKYHPTGSARKQQAMEWLERMLVGVGDE